MYSAEISRRNPSAFLFLIDQSYSTNDKDSVTGLPLANAIADAVNKVINEIVIRCTQSEIMDYFDVGVITYGNEGVGNGFQGILGTQILNPVSLLADNPLRFEQRMKKVSDGAGGIIEQPDNFPVWVEPFANGGTPMRQAFGLASKELAFWCEQHPNSFPPILINITDGEYTDGSPEEIVEEFTRVFGTNDGAILVFNVHVSATERNQIQYPEEESQVPNDYGKTLFRMSSVLTPTMQKMAGEYGFVISPESRGYCMNADISTLVKFLEIGTRGSNLR